MLPQILYQVLLIVGIVQAVSIKGKLDLSPTKITAYTIPRVNFRLYQVGNYSTEEPFHEIARIKDINGTFEFNDLPVNPGVNVSTHYVLSPSSMDFNLIPQRILIEITNIYNETTDEVTPQVKAYRNYFGREHFPSKDILFPEQLDEMDVEPYILILPARTAPFRNYLEQRNIGLFQSGPLAGILNSRWKLAGVITLICVMSFPYLVEKFDPETARAVKAEAERKQREKYMIKTEETNKQIQA